MGTPNGQFGLPDWVQIGARSLLGVQEGRGDAPRPSLGPQMGPDRAAKSVPRWPKAAQEGLNNPEKRVRKRIL